MSITIYSFNSRKQIEKRKRKKNKTLYNEGLKCKAINNVGSQGALF